MFCVFHGTDGKILQFSYIKMTPVRTEEEGYASTSMTARVKIQRL